MSDSATPWTVAYQAPQSMEFSRQEYSSGLPFPSPEDLPNPGIEPRSPELQADAIVIRLKAEALTMRFLGCGRRKLEAECCQNKGINPYPLSSE